MAAHPNRLPRAAAKALGVEGNGAKYRAATAAKALGVEGSSAKYRARHGGKSHAQRP
ncbi:MAG: hypothetical protein OHK0050_16360 [Roseiflexaceae bacterium]